MSKKISAWAAILTLLMSILLAAFVSGRTLETKADKSAVADFRADYNAHCIAVAKMAGADSVTLAVIKEDVSEIKSDVKTLLRER